MRQYILKTSAVAGFLLAIYGAIILAVPAPIAAEYWVREMMVIKRHVADSQPGPRVLFVGGSATLFDIDAKAAGEELGLPAINMGLHAGMYLGRLLATIKDVAHKGDVVVLPLEQVYYDCREDWNDWWLRNYLAWDRDYFASLPLWTRIWAVFSAGGPSLVAEVIGNKVMSYFEPNAHPDRMRALGAPETIWVNYELAFFAPANFLIPHTTSTNVEP